MRIAVVLISHCLTAVTLFVMLWSVIPAPLYQLFMVSVAASEWSLWFGGSSLIGTILGVWSVAHGSPRLGTLSVIIGLLALVLAAKPPLQAAVVASREGVRLSPRRYLLGSAKRNVVETQNIVFARVEQEALRLDVYRPGDVTASSLLPAIIIVHGGSWSGGDKAEFVPMSCTLAQGGAVVFDVQYRLASAEHLFPTQIADVKCAIGWVKANAPTYNVDPQRVALLGRSAGGQLALLAAYMGDDTSIQPTCAVGDTSVRAVISFYAPVDLAWGYRNVLYPDVVHAQAALRNYIGGPVNTRPEQYALASPNTHVRPTSPPSLIIHGGADRLVSVQHARFMDEALQRAGVPHRLLILPWANHGFDFASDSWGAQISESLIRDFLRQHLGY